MRKRLFIHFIYSKSLVWSYGRWTNTIIMLSAYSSYLSPASVRQLLKQNQYGQYSKYFHAMIAHKIPRQCVDLERCLSLSVMFVCWEMAFVSSCPRHDSNKRNPLAQKWFMTIHFYIISNMMFREICSLSGIGSWGCLWVFRSFPEWSTLRLSSAVWWLYC